MKIYMAGVNHFDPLCRENLIKWFTELVAINDNPPAFIAVEYDKDHFEQIKKQRKRFRRLIQNEWPYLSSDKVDILQNSLGYEGDAHLQVFPAVELLWLDEGRQVNNKSIIINYAEDRLKIYAGSWSVSKPLSINQLSENIRKIEASGVSSDRDVEFARLIQQRISKGGGSWAIAVVGSSHASEKNQGSMRYLLEDAGLLCEVTDVQLL